jgi:hypothetical protein
VFYLFRKNGLLPAYEIWTKKGGGGGGESYVFLLKDFEVEK